MVFVKSYKIMFILSFIFVICFKCLQWYVVKLLCKSENTSNMSIPPFPSQDLAKLVLGRCYLAGTYLQYFVTDDLKFHCSWFQDTLLKSSLWPPMTNFCKLALTWMLSATSMTGYLWHHLKIFWLNIGQWKYMVSGLHKLLAVV